MMSSTTGSEQGKVSATAKLSEQLCMLMSMMGVWMACAILLIAGGHEDAVCIVHFRPFAFLIHSVATNKGSGIPVRPAHTTAHPSSAHTTQPRLCDIPEVLSFDCFLELTSSCALMISS
jgi:hypothetical protein